MLRKLLITLGLLLLTHAALLAQGTLKGKITDSENGEALPYVNLIVTQGGQQRGGASSDDNGEYTVKSLPAGTYDIEVKYIGYADVKLQGVTVSASGFTVRNIKMTSTAYITNEVIVYDTVPVIEVGNATTSDKRGADQIERMPVNTVDGIVATMAGVGYNDGGTSTVRGQDQAMVVMQGGILRRGGAIMPTGSIQEIEVILGGTPARYGEAIGGVQVITLKPPAPKFAGTVRFETTEFLDNRGYNRLDLYLTGPIWTKKTAEGVENTIMGYRISAFGQYQRMSLYRPDDDALYLLKDDKREEIEQTPLLLHTDPSNPLAVNYRADYLRTDDFEQVSRFDNAWNATAYLDGAMDIKFSPNAVLAVDAEYIYSKGMSNSSGLAVMNNGKAPQGMNQSLQIAADFTHSFPDEKDSKSIIKRLMYNISGSYYYAYSSSYDPDFNDDFFNYGYIGKFVTQKQKIYTMDRYTINGAETWVWKQNGAPADVNVDFTPANTNPLLANYNSQLYADPKMRPYLTSLTNIGMLKGLVNGNDAPQVYGLYSAPGTVVTGYSKSQLEQYYFQAKVSGDIKRHSIEFGIQYQRLVSRSYSLTANSLWTIMYQEANAHIAQLDLDNPIIDYSGMYPIVSFNQLYDAASQTHFDKSLRQKLGLPVDGTDWLDIHSYDPSTYSLDMFSPDELFNSGRSLISYTGYDHTGEKVSGKKSLDDFFNNSSRTLGAWTPEYMAAYIQDQFYFQDLIFNVGVRVDRYDGNQMVLKDPYLLYDSKTVKEVSGNMNPNGSHPVGAKDDWVVYVNKYSGNTDEIQITGYRSGSTWYDAQGIEVSDPDDVRSRETGVPTPYRKNATDSTISVDAFKEYEPQYVFMPRIAFSFPVTTESQFKASYDIIARRPPEAAWQANYLGYMFMKQIESITNPNLKPEKVTNYEIGFQQALNKMSAIMISAYYKETRDLIQLVQYAGADPNPNYFSYDNLDFKTVKGITLTYDLRRSKNMRLNANYTLQYAEGTWLPLGTMNSLIKAGYPNLKTLNPIDDDRRHQFKLNFDFRYGEGKDYNGPTTTRVVKDEEGNPRSQTIKWLQNAGVNLVVIAQSGRPYTKAYSNVQRTIVGSYNGASLPWQFFVDMDINKTWGIKVGKRKTYLTAYASVKNLLDIRNIVGVYAVTGDPDDNGYLSDPETQAAINAKTDPQAYRDMYSLSLLNTSYGNYSIPRMLKLGVRYSF